MVGLIDELDCGSLICCVYFTDCMSGILINLLFGGLLCCDLLIVGWCYGLTCLYCIYLLCDLID